MVAMLGRAVIGTVAHLWFDLKLFAKRPVLLALVVLVAALWINQQLHAPLLMTRAT